jgi:TPP-dependent indolepyruvate ferredoxin oxidoreductase alpha subunit
VGNQTARIGTSKAPLEGVGSLATIATKQPRNLFIVVLDNEHYGETGMQETATRHGTAGNTDGLTPRKDAPNALPDDSAQLRALFPCHRQLSG